jgi:hypothetical protein
MHKVTILVIFIHQSFLHYRGRGRGGKGYRGRSYWEVIGGREEGMVKGGY